jgi:hypothetical protein
MYVAAGVCPGATISFMKRHLLALVCSFLIAGIAYAGAPLKGVDVKLGRSPGGGAAARTITTDANGKVTFGVLPKGLYTITLRMQAQQQPMQSCFVTIDGIAAVPYKVEWDFKLNKPSPVQPPDASMRTKNPAANDDKIVFESDGVHPVSATIVKSKSNITNN